MKFMLLSLILLSVTQGITQNYTSQDMTLQLDENGEATLVPEDVLVSTTGMLLAYGDTHGYPLRFHYDQETQTLDFVTDDIERCFAPELFHSAHDRNPINHKEYISASNIEGEGYFTGPINDVNCEGIDVTIAEYGRHECTYRFGAPNFTIDRDGVFYLTGGGNTFVFDIYSNELTLFSDFGAADDFGITYDFENHRLITTDPLNNLALFEINIETGAWNELFQIPNSGGCDAPGLEYIGKDIVLISDYCGGIQEVNLVTEESVVLASNYFLENLLFIEDEIPDATLSQSLFTCSDVGEQTVDITVLENGNPVNYQATVNVVPDFSVRNCVFYRRLTLTDPNGSDAARLDDYTDTIEIVSSCSSSFTVTQTPPSGTLIPHGELVDIILTVTDEFGNTTLCKTIGCSDSPLSVDDNPLQNNFVVAPNPTFDHISIENKNNWYVSHIEILDISGRILEAKEIKSGGNTMSLSLSPYSSGSYFVRINATESSIVKQIIKQ